jgi:hypothetical protein
VALNAVASLRSGRMAVEIESTDRRMTFTITWPKVLALVGTLIVGMGGATLYLGEKVLAAFENSVSELRAETGQRFAGREEEDRDIRTSISQEVAGLRSEIATLGDRIVASTEDVGTKIDTLRTNLIASMQNGNALLEKRIQDGDTRLEQRFDRLENKMDDLMKRINLEWKTGPTESGGTFQVNE